nr:MAG TPA: hypothetical protein [Caudoviricetes sp.]
MKLKENTKNVVAVEKLSWLMANILVRIHAHLMDFIVFVKLAEISALGKKRKTLCR